MVWTTWMLVRTEARSGRMRSRRYCRIDTIAWMSKTHIL